MTAAEMTSLRERKKTLTRDALRRAAVALTARHGLDGVTVEQIAAAADVSPRTFFNYFQSKEDAVVGWDPQQLELVVAAITRAPADQHAFAVLRSALLEMFGQLEFDRDETLERLQVIGADPRLTGHQAGRWEFVETALIAALAARPKQGRVDRTVLALTVATTLAGCRVALMAWADAGGRKPVTGYVEQSLDRLATGLDPASVTRTPSITKRNAR